MNGGKTCNRPQRSPIYEESVEIHIAACPEKLVLNDF